MRRSKLIPFIILALVVALIAYRLHETKKPQVVFSEDGLIIGDGGGPYEDGVQGVVIEERFFRLDLSASSRSVYVKFEDMRWKDEGLRDTAPKLPSGNYRIALTLFQSVYELDVGERVSPDVQLVFYEDGEQWFASIAASLDHPNLYLTRIDEDTWILDVDSWFELSKYTPEGEVAAKYYVRLNFTATMNVKSLI